MGRKTLPVDLLLINGNKNRLTKAEIEERKANENNLKMNNDKIKPPSWLDTTAKKEFKRLVAELMQVDLINNVDVNALATYCDAYSDYIECTRIIQEEGLLIEYTNKAAETNKVPHPLLTKKKALFEQMKSIATEFGLTPSARARLSMPKKEEKELSPEEKMFGDV